LRIVHVIDSGGFYGAESMLTQLTKEQIVLGHSVLVFSIGTIGEVEKKIEHALHLADVDVKRWRMSAIPTPTNVKEMLGFLNNLGCDVVHSHGYKGNILLGALPKRCRNFALISTLHGYTKHPLISKMTLYQFVDKLMLARIDAVALVSEAMTATIRIIGNRHNVHVVPNGIEDINLEESVPNEPLSQNAGNDTLTIGALGRLSKEKNFSLLLRAMPDVLKRFPKAKLVIHGEGPQRSELNVLIKKLGLSSCVRILPYTSDVLGFLERIDVYVNCSTTEGMPISLLEAMRSRKLIVATDIPGNRALLGSVDQIGGLCALDKQSLSGSICKVWSASVDVHAEQMRLYRSEFLKQYTSRVMAKRYDELYKGAMINFENRS
tara:strand:- start:2184 stop:3317 length:1134 start_codon:yes stop_codon:yes gene_type:complete